MVCNRHRIQNISSEAYFYHYMCALFDPFLCYLAQGNLIYIKAATILRLLGNETIQFNTRVKKSEPGLRKQLKRDLNLLQNLIFLLKYMNTFIFFLM